MTMIAMTTQTKIKVDQKSFSREANDNVKVRFTTEENGNIIFPLSSEEPYKRWYWEHGELDEILSHDKKSVDLTFLNSGHAPLLDSHRTHNGLAFQIGVVRKAWLEDDRVYVEVSFSNRDEAQAVYEDVKAGIISNVSVGYEITKYEIDEKAKTFTATQWKPREASFVPIPADPTVGVGRSIAEGKGSIMEPTANLPGMGDDAPTEDQRAESMETAINEISALASEHNMGDIGRSYINGQLQRGETPSLAVFKGVVRSKLPEDTPLTNTDVGLTDRETQRFSVMKLMRSLTDDAYRADAAFELEVSEAARVNQEKIGIKSRHGGVVLPTDIMGSWGRFTTDDGRTYDGRSFNRAPVAAGTTPNVQTIDHMAEKFIDNLRNSSSVLKAGATMMSGLDSNIEIPGGDQNIEVHWLDAEGADAQESVPTFRKISGNPHDVAGFTDVTRRMMQQSTIDIEMYVRMQLLEAARLAVDSAGLYGSGVTGIPEGVANTTGIGSVAFATPGAPTREEVIDMRTSIANTNRGRGVTYLGDSDMVGHFQKLRTDAGSGLFVMNDSADRLVGNKYLESNQVNDGDLFAGAWMDMLIMMWGGIQLDMDKAALFLSAGHRFRLIQSIDVDFTRVGSFVRGS